MACRLQGHDDPLLRPRRRGNYRVFTGSGAQCRDRVRHARTCEHPVGRLDAIAPSGARDIGTSRCPCRDVRRSAQLALALPARAPPNGRAFSYSWVTARPAPPDRAAQAVHDVHMAAWARAAPAASQCVRPSQIPHGWGIPGAGAVAASARRRRWWAPTRAAAPRRGAGRRCRRPGTGRAPGARQVVDGVTRGQAWRSAPASRRTLAAPLGASHRVDSGMSSSSPTGPPGVVRRVWTREWFHMWNPAGVVNRNSGP